MQQTVDGDTVRYNVLATLGSGGFATVYRAEDAKLGREVAIKVLHPHLAANQSFVRRFRAEARAAARLHHDYIVTVFDVSETADGRSFMVMELLEGAPLARLIALKAPLPEKRAIAILAQLADALDYLHSKGLVHRDVKPANVMVRANDVIKLMDFGIARTLDDQSRLTQTGEVVGTVAYTAPEQIAGETVGPAADIYSLGVVAYELFAGRPPFIGSPSEVVHQQRFRPPPPVTNFNPGVSPAVKAGIEAALAKDPAARPRSARAFVQGLTTGTGSASDPPRAPARAARQATARNLLLRGRTFSLAGRAVGAVLLVLALMLDVAHANHSGGGTSNPSPAALAANLVSPMLPKKGSTAVHSTLPTAKPQPAPSRETSIGQTRDSLLTPSSDTAHWVMESVDGEYRITKTDPAWGEFGNASSSATYTDSVVDVDAHIMGDAADRAVEVGCRSQINGPGANEYRMTVVPSSGQFALWREDSGTLVPLMGYQSSPAIEAGAATNHLQIACIGSTITGRINGEQVASVQDTTYQSGHVFVRAGVLESALPATVDARFSHLAITQP